MFLMKEVNDPESKYDWTLSSLLRDMFDPPQGSKTRSFYPMWKNVSRWALCVQNPALTFDGVNSQQLLQGLKLVATTNLKKAAGGGTSHPKDILQHARTNQPHWEEEIRALNPDLVVCAGTFGIVASLYADEVQVKTCCSGVQYFVKDDRVFVGVVHPAYFARSQRQMFDDFKTAYNCLLEHGVLRTP